MLSPLRTQSIVLDVPAEPFVPDASAKLSALNREFSIADAQISRGRTLRRLIAANVLAWIVIVMIVRLIFF